MFCKKCGTECDDKAIFCPNCGFNLVDIMEQIPPPRNGMAIAGFICSFFSPLLGWIFGGIGLSRSYKRLGKGQGLSVAALIIASFMFILGFQMS